MWKPSWCIHFLIFNPFFLQSKRETMMFYPTDPSEMYGLFALRLGKYKAHFYTRGTVTFTFTIWKRIKHYHSQNWGVFDSCLSVFVHQVLPTAAPPQTKTARYSQSSRPTTPLSFLTWRLTPQRTTLSPCGENRTSKPWWRGSRKSRRSLKPPWCSERARYQKDQTRTWSLAAILIVARSPAAASVDGDKLRQSANDDNVGKAGGTALILLRESTCDADFVIIWWCIATCLSTAIL